MDANRQLEYHVVLPLHLVVGLFRFVELPFLHLFPHIDGEATSLSLFIGPAWQTLVGTVKLWWINFQLIYWEIPETDRNLFQ